MSAQDEHQHVFITAREFDNAMRTIQTAMAEGFGGIHERLDKLNSKTDKNITDINNLRITEADVRQKVSNLIREVFDRPSRQTPTPPELAPKPSSDEDSKPITRRDLNVAVGVGIIAVGIVVWMFMMFGPHIQKGGS